MESGEGGVEGDKGGRRRRVKTEGGEEKGREEKTKERRKEVESG